eukprot:TRINITY_DN27028_c0_g1_i1.p2 TRINITY_DN27028_c0_g1~~TRINITY_DN27028_c0_g1_i1.p2  ORF type:complete len:120 (+),score=13.77 TRINITY_DN27028_c0_g1_i1:236-595(+)
MSTVDAELFQRRDDKNPMVLVGALVTAGVLVAGLVSFKKGNDRRSQMLMRARVVAQGATVALMIGTIGVQGFAQRWENMAEKMSAFGSRGGAPPEGSTAAAVAAAATAGGAAASSASQS